MQDPDPTIDALREEIAALRAEVSTLNQHRFIRVHNSIWRLMGVQVLRGLAMGFGTVAGGTIIVSAIAYSLSQIDFIPIIGDWASEIAREIQSGIKPQ